MPNSVSKGFDTAMKTGSSRRFKRYPTTYMWVSSWLPFTVDWGLSWFILILSKGKLTWHSPIGCGVSFESSCLARFHGSAKTHAYWVWYSLQIGELCPVTDLKSTNANLNTSSGPGTTWPLLIFEFITSSCLKRVLHDRNETFYD